MPVSADWRGAVACCSNVDVVCCSAERSRCAVAVARRWLFNALNACSRVVCALSRSWAFVKANAAEAMRSTRQTARIPKSQRGLAQRRGDALPGAGVESGSPSVRPGSIVESATVRLLEVGECLLQHCQRGVRGRRLVRSVGDGGSVISRELGACRGEVTLVVERDGICRDVSRVLLARCDCVDPAVDIVERGDDVLRFALEGAGRGTRRPLLNTQPSSSPARNSPCACWPHPLRMTSAEPRHRERLRPGACPRWQHSRPSPPAGLARSPSSVPRHARPCRRGRYPS